MKQALPRMHRPLGAYVAMAILALAVAVMAGCTMTGDNVTGVSLDKGGPTSCVKQCNDFFKGEYQNEQKTHAQNVEYCQTLSQPDKSACLNAESLRHSAAKDALTAAKIECQNSCHRQGGGSAG